MKPEDQNIKILPPNINESHWFYKATSDGIYLSLGAIKGVGYQSVKLIVDERYQNGEFKDFFDFARRLPKRVKTRKLLESLILVGAFDTFGKTVLRYYSPLTKLLIKLLILNKMICYLISSRLNKIMKKR